MANERRDHEEQTESSAGQEPVKNEADISEADRKEKLNRVKDDELTDDRFQATDN